MKAFKTVRRWFDEAREVDKISEKVATLIYASKGQAVSVSTQEVIQAFEEIETGLTAALESRQRAIVVESQLISKFLKRK